MNYQWLSGFEWFFNNPPAIIAWVIAVAIVWRMGR